MTIVSYFLLPKSVIFDAQVTNNSSRELNTKTDQDKH